MITTSSDMSRSYKKPYLKDGYKSKSKKLAKRWANRAVRKEDNLASGKQYRKVYNPWDICDWIFYEPKNPKSRRK